MMPVVLIDTGYLFDETYEFIDQLVERLDLQLRVYRPRISPAWQEKRFGRRWEQGPEGIRQYNQMNKIEPMERALRNCRSAPGSAACGACSPTLARISLYYSGTGLQSRSVRSRTGVIAMCTNT